jgi:hypothetical protein
LKCCLLWVLFDDSLFFFSSVDGTSPHFSFAETQHRRTFFLLDSQHPFHISFGFVGFQSWV